MLINLNLSRKLKRQVIANVERESLYPEMDQHSTMDELEMAIKNTKDSASKYKVYKKFWIFLKKIWLNGVRSKSWSKAIVVPIPKISNVKTPDQSSQTNLINSRTKLIDKMANARIIYTFENNNIINTTSDLEKKINFGLFDEFKHVCRKRAKEK